MDYRTKIVQVKDKNIKLQIVNAIQWDLVTTRNVRPSNQSFFRGQHGIFLIFDKTRRETFDSLQRWVYQVCQHKDMVKILVGNKCDLTSEVNQDEISAFANLHKMNYVETSAKTGYNVETMFLSATEEALAYMDRGLYSDPCLGFFLESNHLISNRYNICC